MIELAPGRLIYSLAPGFSGDPAPELRDALLKVTGERREVLRGEGEGTPTLRERDEAAKAEEDNRVRNSPIVQAAFEAFPGAELVDEGKDGSWSKRA